MNNINTPIQKHLKTLIFTDLDGSLLDHFDYNTEPVNQLLATLEERNIPIIFCTSKTFSEVLQIRQELNNHHPFIIENGAAVFIPKGYFPPAIESTLQASHHPDYLHHSFCKSRQDWLNTLETLKPRYSELFTHFYEMGPPAIAKATGLPVDKAEMANDRHFSEPILWTGDTEMKQQFINEMRQLGAEITEGGRFLHLIGQCNKGSALSFLFNLYQQQQNEPITSIALGDGKNDIPMLESAKHAVLIRSPVHPFPNVHKETVIKTDHYGPHGWAEGIKKILQLH